MHALHDIIARPLNVNGGVIGRCVLLNRVALVGLDLEIAFLCNFSYSASRATA